MAKVQAFVKGLEGVSQTRLVTVDLGAGTLRDRFHAIEAYKSAHPELTYFSLFRVLPASRG